MNRFIITVACTSMIAGLSGCYQNDPIKEKERLIAERNRETKKETPKPDTDPKDKESGKEEGKNPEDNKTPEIKEITKDVFYDFELWAQPDSYYKDYYIPLTHQDESPKITESFWVSPSNQGYTRVWGKKPFYPVHSLSEGYEHISVEMEGVAGMRALGLGSKIIPGVLFSGWLDKSKMNGGKDQYLSTLYGKPWEMIPKEITLYYQYKPGAQLINQTGEQVTDRDEDTGLIECVFYEVTASEESKESYLNGQTFWEDGENVISRIHQVVSKTKENEWVKITLPFKVINQVRYNSIDFKQKKYRLALSFTTSERGASYIGAIGSKFRIDNLSVHNIIK